MYFVTEAMYFLFTSDNENFGLNTGFIKAYVKCQQRGTAGKESHNNIENNAISDMILSICFH